MHRDATCGDKPAAAFRQAFFVPVGGALRLSRAGVSRQRMPVLATQVFSERRCIVKFHGLFKTAAVIALVFGIGFVLAPAQLASLYNLTLDGAGLYVGRLFGALLIGIGVINWSAATLQEQHGTRAVALGNLVGDGLGFVIALLVQLNGVAGINRLGWLNVVIYLLLAAGFAYLLYRIHQHHDMPTMQHG
jgi:hypothetical protein